MADVKKLKEQNDELKSKFAALEKTCTCIQSLYTQDNVQSEENYASSKIFIKNRFHPTNSSKISRIQAPKTCSKRTTVSKYRTSFKSTRMFFTKTQRNVYLEGVDSDSSHAYQESTKRGSEPPQNATQNRLENTSTAVEVEAKKMSSSDLQISVAAISIKPSRSQDSLREPPIKETSSAMITRQRSIIAKNNKYKTNTNSTLKIGYQFGAKSLPRNASCVNLPVSKNESLRWDNPADGSDEEDERIRLYKINRRKRYLAAAQAKGLGWAANYKNGTPVNEDSGVDAKDSRTAARNDNHMMSDFSPIKSLAPATNSGLAMVEC